MLPGSSPAEAVITSGITSFLSLYNAALVGRLLLTWFPNPPQAIVGPLSCVFLEFFACVFLGSKQ